MQKKLTTPKLKRAEEKGKVTLYFSKEIAKLYKVGKENGWDTPAIVAEAASEALKQHSADLMINIKKPD